MESLYERLIRYGHGEDYPFHMPGHKRNPELTFENPFQWDITEIQGFDDLHHPQGILKEAMDEAAALYGSGKTFFLVNGSSCGLLAAIGAVSEPGGRLLAARNCHKAVYHGILQGQLKASYVYPQRIEEWGINGGILPENVEILLKKEQGIKGVVITSPTYEGVVSDVASLAKICHQYGAALIIDEAHGAHFPFGKAFPPSALELGADVVIQSLHKTLPSLTQTALLHVGKESLIPWERIQKYLSVYESSSPSYVLMASADQCIRYMRGAGRRKMEWFEERLKKLHSRLSACKNIRFLERTPEMYGWDFSKVFCRLPGRGEWLVRQFRERYHIEPEMWDGDSVLFMTSLMDREEGFQRLEKGAMELDEEAGNLKLSAVRRETASVLPKRGEPVLTLSQAFWAEKENMALWESEGHIAGEFVYLYPPGIPVFVPGERITRDGLSYLSYQAGHGAHLKGMEDPDGERIFVIRERKGI